MVEMQSKWQEIEANTIPGVSELACSLPINESN